MPVYRLNGSAPQISPDAWIAPAADVIGRVRLAAGVTVWFGAVIRADNADIEVGEATNIQDGVMLHADPGAPLLIGRSVTVGHHAILHGCTIEDEVLIGMGATVLNGAVIGQGCLVGARSLVTEGKVFDPGSLILGSPAKAVGRVIPEQMEAIATSASDYSGKGARYRAQLIEASF